MEATVPPSPRGLPPEHTHRAGLTRGETRLRLTLDRWCLWYPGANVGDRCWPDGQILSGGEDSGRLDFIPMMQRRRLSPLARAAIAVAWHCRGSYRELPAVFFSRHGESHYYFDMLHDLAKPQEISPSRFSLSVHNAIAGLYSLCSETRAACVAFAGGGDDFYGMFLEVAGMLMENACDRVLLVCYDQPLPEAYRRFVVGPDRTLAIGMRLSAGSSAGTKIELTGTAAAVTPDTGCQLQAFCEAILRGERHSEVSTGRRWQWELTDG